MSLAEPTYGVGPPEQRLYRPFEPTELATQRAQSVDTDTERGLVAEQAPEEEKWDEE